MLLILAILSMLFAVTAYTIAVFSERKARKLKKKHLYIFGFGLFFDTLGTTIMNIISESTSLDMHGLIGLIALLLMMFHVIFAAYIYLKGSGKAKENFHFLSVIIWMIWLMPFVSGLLMNM